MRNWAKLVPESVRKRERLNTFTSSSVSLRLSRNNCGNCKENLTDCSQVVAGVENGLEDLQTGRPTDRRQMSALTFKTGGSECSRQPVRCLSLFFFFLFSFFVSCVNWKWKCKQAASGQCCHSSQCSGKPPIYTPWKWKNASMKMFGQPTTTTLVDNQMTNVPWKLSLISFRFPFVQVALSLVSFCCLACHTSSFRIAASLALLCVHWGVCKRQIKPGDSSGDGDWSGLLRSISMPATEVTANENEKWETEGTSR